MKTKTLWLAWALTLFLPRPAPAFTSGVAYLGLTTTASEFMPTLSQQVTFQWVLTNGGPDNVTATIAITNFLSSGLQYVSDTGAGAYNSGTRIWTVPSLPANSSVSLSLTATATALGPQTNRLTTGAPPGYTDTATPNAFAFVDVTAPNTINVSCSSNITVNATSQSGATVFFAVSASGGCGTPIVSANPPSGSTFPIGTTTVLVGASDTCGNTGNCSFTVTVNGTPINLTCSSNITVNATSQSGATVFFAVSASGGCSIPIVSANPPSGSMFPIGTNIVVTTATDSCGNRETCNFTVTVTVPSGLGLPVSLGISSVTGQVTMSWPLGSPYWVETATNLQTNSWVAVTNTPATDAGVNTLTAPITGAVQFFRLIYSPLPPPVGLSLEAEEDQAGDSWMALWWTAVSQAVSYNLYYAASPTVSPGNYSSLPGGGELSGITNNYVTVSNLIPGLQYYYIVTAASSVGQSIASPQATGIFGPFATVAGAVSTFLTGENGVFEKTLSGATVTLSNLTRPSLSVQTVTDQDGEYAFSRQPAGTYQLCWSAPGFLSGCNSNLLVVSNQPLDIDLALTNDGGGLIFGHVSMADGSYAVQNDPFFGIQQNVSVSLISGGQLLQSVSADSAGDYLMSDVPFQNNLTVLATNGMVGVSSNINLTGIEEVDLALPDTPPMIVHLTASLNGLLVTRAPPGSQLTVDVVATNAGGNLYYTWIPGTGDAPGFVSVNSPTVQWTLPETMGDQVMYVVVSDAIGGCSTARLDVSTDQGSLFVGQVVDINHVPIEGAAVSVNGQSTESDILGSFSLVVTNVSTNYTLLATQAGYAPFLMEFDEAEQSVVCVMLPFPGCTQATSTTNIILEDSLGTGVLIPSNSLGTASGAAVQNPLCMTLETFMNCSDTNVETIDTGLLNGTNVYLHFVAMAWVSGSDANGNTLVLTNEEMQLIIAADTNCLNNLGGPPPATGQLWWLDLIKLVWVPMGPAAASVTSTGAPAFDCLSSNLGMLAVAVAEPPPKIVIFLDIDATIAVPVNTRILDTQTGALIREDTLGRAPVFNRSQQVVVPQIPLTIQVLSPKEAPEVYTPTPDDANKTVIAQVLVAGALTNGTHVPIGLSAQIPDLTAARVNQSEQFLVFKFGAGTGALATNYYSLVDKLGLKMNLAGFESANGFTVSGVRQPDDASAYFFNACDLGFGRSMHMKKKVAEDKNNDYAFYVSNHPSAADAVSNRDVIATVAMDYVYNPETKTRITAFYAYDKAGARLYSADLDGRGEKYLPTLCLSCHGADKGLNNDFKKGQSERGDLGARFIPFDIDSYTYSAIASLSESNQAASFLALNQAVMNTGPTDAMTNLIEGWYGGVTLPTPFNAAFVPAGWTNTVANNNIRPGYSGSFAISCRSCHVVRDDDKAFINAGQLDPIRAQESVFQIGTRPMPNALRTFTIFWGSEGANIIKTNGVPPDQTLLLAQALGLTNVARPSPPK
jgi:uncharacterized repeat protein (TIGR01451 family)